MDIMFRIFVHSEELERYASPSKHIVETSEELRERVAFYKSLENVYHITVEKFADIIDGKRLYVECYNWNINGQECGDLS